MNNGNPLISLTTEVTARVTMSVQLIVCGIGVLIAPRAFLRYLKREFERL